MVLLGLRSRIFWIKSTLPLTRTLLWETNRKNKFIHSPFNNRALNPGGVRLGTPAVTTRGMLEPEMEIIADFLMKGIEISKRIQEKVGKQLKDFIPAIEDDEEVKKVGDEVKAFASKFSIPGI